MVKILSMSGWAQPHDALHSLIPDAEHLDYSAYKSPDALFAYLSEQSYDAVVAWSLGAQLAVRATLEGVLKPKWMVLLAPPLQFVNDATFDAGMDPVTFAQFHQSYSADPQRTLSRFHGLLVKGDRHMRRILPLLGHHPEVQNVSHWLPWLNDLADVKHTDFCSGQLPPTLLIQGKEDVIVPCTQAEAWQARFTQIESRIVEAMGHTPHLHDEALLRRWIDEHGAKHAL